MPRAGIALGANLGDRLAQLRAAASRLQDLSTAGEPVLSAPIYQTQPRHCPPGSPAFLNSVIEISFAGNPHALLDITRSIEHQLGRLLSPLPNAPRVIDLDLLYLGDMCCADEWLTLPHPRLTDRRFVLQPLADIRPDLVLPGQSLTVAGLLAKLPPDEPPLTIVSEHLIL